MHRSASPRPGYSAGRSGSLASPRLGARDRAVAQLQGDESPALNFLARRGSEAQNSDDTDDSFDREVAMANAERELKADAEWKRIQQNTFTRWTNEHLKTVDKTIEDLGTDFSDGLKLIALIEVLSNKKMPKHNKRPNFRSQKLENVSIALEFLEREGITLVNIDSTDIVDCKLKLILGLIWTLILHYAISMPMWDGPPLGGAAQEKTPKQRLMDWVKDKVPMLNNFTTDFNDGKAIGALVDNVAPGLCPDWENWDPKRPVQNAREAMDLADKWLNVPKLLTPEELVNPNVDEQSMMTYLSQFPHAKLKSGAPLRKKTDATKVRAYGPGLEPKGLVAKAPANFTVETFGAGDGELAVKVVQVATQKELDCEIVFNNDRKVTYSCSYFPEEEGDYVVTITWSNREIPDSPYQVNVEGFAGDANKVTASGPGLLPEGVIINRPTYFEIFAKGAGKGSPDVIILDPKGKKDSVPIQITPHPTEPETHKCEYVATILGLHSVNVFFAGNPIPNSPFGVRVSPASLPSKVWANGRGLQPTGIRLNETVDFKVYTEGAGEGKVGVKIIGPGGIDLDYISRAIDATTTEFTYTPKRDGRHIIMITFANVEIPRSPFEVMIGKHKTSKIKAYGPGLKGGIVNKPAKFTVDTCGETGALGFSIQGPSQAKINCKDNGDGSAEVEYIPTAEGEYAVHILCDKEDIPGSPYMAQIIPATDFDPDKVKVFGPGVENGVNPKEETHFTVDISDAGNAPLEIYLVDDLGQFEPKINKISEAVFECFYTPRAKQHKQTVFVNFGGVAVPGSPFRVLNDNPNDPSLVEVYGPGVEPGVRAGCPVEFTVDCSKSGPGDVTVNITSAKRKTVPVAITDNGDDTYTVTYEAQIAGPQTIVIALDDTEVPQSPIKLDIKPAVDLSKIKLVDFEPEAFVDCPNDFVVDTSDLPSNLKSQIQCEISGPDGNPVEADVSKMGPDGPFQVSYIPTEEGDHEVDLRYDGTPLPDSPFPVTAIRGCNPQKVKAYGDGLEKGIVDEVNAFTIETRNAGTGGLGIAVEGPSEAEMNCMDNKDGTCTVEYVPVEEGDYDIAIKFDDEHIPGSPFQVPVTTKDGKPKVDPRKVKAYGPGLEPESIFPGKPTSFVVDASETGEAPLEVIIGDGQTDEDDDDLGSSRKGSKLGRDDDGLGSGSRKGSRLGSSGDDSRKGSRVSDDDSSSRRGSKLGSRKGSDLFGEEDDGFGIGNKEGKGLAALRARGDSLSRKGSNDLSDDKLGRGDNKDAQDASRRGSRLKSISDNDRKSRKGSKTPFSQPIIVDKGDGTHEVSYVPPPVGDPYEIAVRYAGVDIPGSPFLMTCNPNIEDVVNAAISDGLGSRKGSSAISPERSFSKNGTGIQRQSIVEESKGPRGVSDLIRNALPGSLDAKKDSADDNDDENDPANGGKYNRSGTDGDPARRKGSGGSLGDSGGSRKSSSDSSGSRKSSHDTPFGRNLGSRQGSRDLLHRDDLGGRHRSGLEDADGKRKPSGGSASRKGSGLGSHDGDLDNTGRGSSEDPSGRGLRAETGREGPGSKSKKGSNDNRARKGSNDTDGDEERDIFGRKKSSDDASRKGSASLAGSRGDDQSRKGSRFDDPHGRRGDGNKSLAGQGTKGSNDPNRKASDHDDPFGRNESRMGSRSGPDADKKRSTGFDPYDTDKRTGLDSPDANSRKGSGFGANDPNNRRGSELDPNDSHAGSGLSKRKGSKNDESDSNPHRGQGSDQNDPNSKLGSGIGPHDGSRKGSSFDDGDSNKRKGSQRGPNDPYFDSNDKSNRKGLGYDPNDPNNRKGSGCDPNDPNDPNNRRGSGYDPNNRRGSGFDPNDPNNKRGSGFDPNDPSNRRGSGYDPSSENRGGLDPSNPNYRRGSEYDPKDPTNRKGSGLSPSNANNKKEPGYDPNDPSSRKGSGHDPNDPNNRRGSDYDPNDPKTRRGSGLDPSNPNYRKGSGYDPDDSNIRRGSRFDPNNRRGHGHDSDDETRRGAGIDPSNPNYGRGSGYDPNDLNSRKGFDSNDPYNRRGSGYESTDPSSRKGSGSDPNDPYNRRGSGYDDNDPNNRRGSGYDPNNKRGSGYDPNDPDKRKGSGYDPNDSNNQKESGLDPNYRKGSAYDPNDPYNRRGSGHDPNDPSYRRGSEFDPNDSSFRRGSGVDSDDPYSRRGFKLDSSTPGHRKGSGCDPSDPNYRKGSELDNFNYRRGDGPNNAFSRKGSALDSDDPRHRKGSDLDSDYRKRPGLDQHSPDYRRGSGLDSNDPSSRKASGEDSNDNKRGSSRYDPNDSRKGSRYGPNDSRKGAAYDDDDDMSRKGSRDSFGPYSEGRRGSGDGGLRKGHGPEDLDSHKPGHGRSRAGSKDLLEDDNSGLGRRNSQDSRHRKGGRRGPGGLGADTSSDDSADDLNDNHRRGSRSSQSRKGSHEKSRKTHGAKDDINGNYGGSRKNSRFDPVELSNIPIPSTGGDVSAQVRTPSNAMHLPHIEDNGNGSVGVFYQPTEAGPHSLDVRYNGEHVQGSPFKFYASPNDEGKVYAYGPGLTHGVCGDPANFGISTRGAGAGGLSLAVEGPSKADINCIDNKDGTVNVSYLPTAPGEYKIYARFADQHIQGSPFTCKVTGEGKKRNAISVGSASELSLPDNISDYDLRSLNAYIVSPSGCEEPCFLKKLPKGNTGISFTPREVGEHLVSVKRSGKHITNSPFKIMVNPEDVGDASRVKVSGSALREGRTHEDNMFTVDTKKAGYGGLSLSVEGPSKAEIKCKDNEDGTLDVSYKPSEPGLYIVNLKFADQHAPGSPFAVAVSGQGTERQTEKIDRMREAVPVTEVGSQCRLTFKMPGIKSTDLRASVTSPTGKVETAIVVELEDGLYAVNFVPYELGVHTVSVMYKEVDIPGSPFQFTVGPLQDGGAHRVHAGGPGLERGVQGKPSDFNVWTREAGYGSLGIAVEGPSKAEVEFKDRKDGSCHVSYTVEEPGEYNVGIRFNDTHIPGSPYKVYILPSADDAERVRMSNMADGPVTLDIPQTMLLNMNGADGDVECKIVAPSGREDDCFITPLGEGEHTVRFVPKEEGVHHLHARLNGIHIPGSPFKLEVRGTTLSDDPSSVAVRGLGIERGTTGKHSKFVIDTSSVGAGTLSITVDGPSKVDLSCNEVEDGYEVSYTPMAPGKYYVTVKYNGKNVRGSPFSVMVGGDNLVSSSSSNRAISQQLQKEQSRSSMTMETMQRTSYIRHQYSEKRVSSMSLSKSGGGARNQMLPPPPKQESDSTKVKVRGKGLEQALISRQNSFTVDCGRAGSNVLYVGVYGPEIPCDEVVIRHQGDKRYSVSYVVHEKGEYIIFVKWGDEHIPGSPFRVVA